MRGRTQTTSGAGSKTTVTRPAVHNEKHTNAQRTEIAPVVHLPAAVPMRSPVLTASLPHLPVHCGSSIRETQVHNDLEDFICSGPLLSSCGITPDQVHEAYDSWVVLGKRLAQQLSFDIDNLTESQRLRIYHYYLPIFFWAQRQIQEYQVSPASPSGPLILGISAPQGCGKTTVVEQLDQLFNWLGVKATSVSIDDFYLTYGDQNKLAAAHPDNKLLQLRGNAGSHDLELGYITLKALKSLQSQDQKVSIPRYDKSAYGGRGDRAPLDKWPSVSGPLQVVFFEGWMSGFRPLEERELQGVDPQVVAVNQYLQKYQQAWDSFVDAWLVIKIADPQWVFNWRLQAEQQMKAQGKPGMTDEQIQDFVSRYIPSYQAYLPGLYQNGPTTARAGCTLMIEVDQNRAPVAKQPSLAL